MKSGSASRTSLPLDLPPLDGPGSALVLAGTGDARLFSLTGRGGTAWGTGLRGVAEIRAAGWTLLSELHTNLGAASNVLVDPLCVRREVSGAGGTVLETLLLALRAPAAVLQWRRPEGSAAPLALQLRWRITRDGGGDFSFDILPDRVRISATPSPSEASAPCAFLVALPSRSWDLRVEDGAVVVSAQLRGEAGGALSLLVAGGLTESDALAAIRVVASPRTEAMRGDQVVEQARQEGLATHTGLRALDEGLEWAKARVRGAVVEETWTGEAHSGASGRRTARRAVRRGGAACPPASESGDSKHERARGVTGSTDFEAGADRFLQALSPLSPLAEEVWTAMGALVSGDAEPAELVLEQDLLTPYHLVLAGRHVAWTGGVGVLASRATRLDEAVARFASADPSPVVALAFRELADAWEAGGEKNRATHLRSLAERASPASRSAVRRLPVLGAQSASNPHEELAGALLDSDVRRFYLPPSTDPASGLERALRAWALCRAGDPEAGYLMFRAHTEAGFEDGWGIWSDAIESAGLTGSRAGPAAAVCADHTASAALVPCGLLFGLLGAAADAPVGRLRLAPRFPGAWRTFEAAGIRMGDALVGLRYRRSGSEHRFRIRQESGRVPVMLVFEPDVPEKEVERSFVDGVEAGLSHRSARGRASVRVQLPLDQEREITVVGKRIAGTL